MAFYPEDPLCFAFSTKAAGGPFLLTAVAILAFHPMAVFAAADQEPAAVLMRLSSDGCGDVCIGVYFCVHVVALHRRLASQRLRKYQVNIWK